MYIVRSESQAFVDAGALAAAAQLDGTDAGVARARTAAAAAWNKFHFHSQNFSTPTMEFALAAGTGSTPPYQTTWTTSPPSPPKNYQFARVTSSLSLPMLLMQVITGSSNATIAARAITGQINITGLSEGLLPFTLLATALTPPRMD